MAGRVFSIGGGARGLTAERVATSDPMVGELLGPAERAQQATVGEQARRDDGRVAR